MGFNVLAYQSHPLQHCDPACGREGSSHLFPLFALCFFIAMQVHHSYNLSTNGRILLTHVPEESIQIVFFTRIELTITVLSGVRGYLLDHSGDEGIL